MRRAAAAVALLLLAAAPAAAAPVLTVDAGHGPAPLLEQFHGRPAVLHLWATWCAPCRDELPDLAAFLAAHPDLAAQVAVVSVDTAPVARVARFLAELDVDLPPLKVASGNAGATYGVTGYPATVFLAADGGVASVHVGPLDWSAPKTLRDVSAHLAR